MLEILVDEHRHHVARTAFEHDFQEGPSLSFLQVQELGEVEAYGDGVVAFHLKKHEISTAEHTPGVTVSLRLVHNTCAGIYHTCKCMYWYVSYV